MSFENFHKSAWQDHATQAEVVASRLAEGVKLIEKSEQVQQMSQLITHVLGEHLGQWKEGIALLRTLRPQDDESAKAIARGQAALELASGNSKAAENLSNSDQIRALALAASALSERRDSHAAQVLFSKALQKAEHELDGKDPANRALAVTGNNLACALEERPARTPDETTLMITAAQTARKYWEIAGTWTQVERAEYRLAMSYLKTQNPDQALNHARICIAVCRDNQAPALEFFFGYEALTLVQRALGDAVGAEETLKEVQRQFEGLSPEDKKWCQASLQKLGGDA